MGRKDVGPMCCVMHVKEPRTLIVKEKGLAPLFLDSCLKHPAGWICAHSNLLYYYYDDDDERQVFIRMPSKQNSFDQKYKNHVKVFFSLPITTKVAFTAILYLWRKIAIRQIQYYDNEAVHSFNTAVVFSLYRKKQYGREAVIYTIQSI